MPERIQLKRTKGWRIPENTVIVDRRSKYGNPFKVVGDMIYCDASHRRKVMDPWVFFAGPFHEDILLAELLKHYREWLSGWTYQGMVKPPEFNRDELRKELKGKNLACWCSLDAKCHADVLLEVANNKPTL